MRFASAAILLAAAMAVGSSATDAAAQHARKQTGYLGIFSGEIIERGSRDQATVTVQDVYNSSPADKAGIKAGDQILRINGMEASNGKFRALANTLVQGDTVKLRIRRDGRERDYTVIAEARPANMRNVTREIVIGTDSVRRLMLRYLDSARVHLDSLHLPDIRITASDSLVDVRLLRRNKGVPDSIFFKRDSSMARIYRVRPGSDDPREFEYEADLGPSMIFRSMELGARSIGGAEFTELDPAMRDYFKTDRGLLTLRVAPDTPARRAGLLPGDIVIKAEGREVLIVPELRSAIAAHPDGVKLEILRKGERKIIELKTRSR